MKALVLTILWTVAVWALPKKELKPSEILFKNLSPEKLDNLLESSLQKLKTDITKSYEDELRQQEVSIENLHRYRRETSTAAAGYNLEPYSSPHHYWHSYTYDTEIGNREELIVDDVSVTGYPGNIVIKNTFPLGLWNISAIYQSDGHIGYVMKNGKLEVVKVRNVWTKSLTGCTCHYGYSQTCACCEEGACVCQSAGDTCVQCGLDQRQDICDLNKPGLLGLDAVVGFQYYLEYYDPLEGLQRIIITSNNTIVTFYKIDEDSAQLLQSENGLGTIKFAKPVTHLGYSEIYKDFHGMIKKDRFLITFKAGETSQQFHSINIHSTGLASGMSEKWQASGSEMKAWQSGGRVMLGVLNNDELLVHELKANQWYEYQVRAMQTLSIGEPIVSWRSFCMGFDNYLVLVTLTKARLYLHSGMQYHPIQDLIPSHGLYSFRAIIPLTIPSWRGKAVLLTGQGTRLIVYVWNGAQQMVQVALTKDLDFSVPNWETVYGHTDMKRDINLVMVPSDVRPVTLEVKARLRELPDPVSLQNQALSQLVSKLEQEFKRQSQVIELAEEKLAHSVQGKTTINANVTVVDGITVVGILETGELKAKEILLTEAKFGGDPTHGHQSFPHVTNLSYYENLLDDLRFNVSNLILKLNNAVPKSGSNRLITGVKSVEDAGLDITTLITEHLTVRQPLDIFGNPFPLDDILAGMVRHNDTRVITGRKTFLGTLTVGDLNTGYLDDIPVNDIVTTEGPQTIAGATFTSGLKARNIVVKPGGTVGGLDLSEEAVLLTAETTLGSCTFTRDLFVDEMVSVSGYVNGIDINQLSTNALTVRGGTIRGSLSFFNSLSIDTLEAQSIMGINTAYYMSTTVFKHTPAVMGGTLVIETAVETKGDLIVEGYINDKSFPKDYPLQTHTNISFGSKRFKNLYVGSVRVGPDCLVDGLSLNRIVTLHTSQIITGEKTFAQGVYIKGNLDITSKLLDGVNLDELYASMSHINTSDWKFDVVFEAAVQAPSLSFGGSLNDFDWVKFAEDIVYDDENMVTISSKKNFRLGLTIRDAIFKSTFNGESFDNLVTTNSKQTIGGRKEFINDVTFGSLTVDLLDGVDLEKMVKSAVYLNKEGQVVIGKKNFTSTLTTKGLEITGGIGNLDLSKVVTKSTDQTFSASQSLRSAIFSTLYTTYMQMTAGSRINTIDLSLLNSRHVSLTSSSHHSGVLTVEGPVSVLGQLTAGTLNGHALEPLLSNFVMKDQSSVITGPVTFASLTVQGPITTYDKVGANGLNISHIDLNAVKLSSSNVISGGVTWGQIILRSDVAVGGRVNGIDLYKFSQDLVSKDSTDLQVITGKKTYVAGLTVLGNIEAMTINGIDLSTKMLTRHTDQTISASYTFLNLEAKKNVTIKGLYNQVNLTRLTASNVLGTDTLLGNVTFFGEMNVEHFRISGYFNGIDTEKRMADGIMVHDMDVVITGKKNFLSNVTFRNINVGSINSVPFKHFLEHLVLKNVANNITHKITVQGSVITPHLIANTLTVQGSVGGVDYNRLLREAVYLHSNQTLKGSLVFTKDLTVMGDIRTKNLNGLNLETDYLTTHTVQTVPFSVTFGNITTFDVVVDGTVNSYNLPEEAANTMKAMDGQNVTGRVTFAGSLVVNKNIRLTGRVGRNKKIDLSEQAIPLNADVEITGSVIFTSPLTVSTLTCTPGIVNGVNIPELYNNAWFVDEPADITGAMVFKGPVIFLEALLRDPSTEPLRIRDLHQNMTAVMTRFNKTKSELELLYKNTCSPIITLYDMLEKAIFEGDHFASIYEYLTPRQRHSSATFFAFNMSYIVMSWEGGNCDSALYSFNPTTPTVQLMYAIPGSGYGHHWLFLGGTNNEVYLAMAASGYHNSCTRRNSVIWKLTKTSIIVHRELAAGEHLTQESSDDVVILYVHATNRTITYSLGLTTGDVKQISNIPGAVDMYRMLETKNGVKVSFQSHQGRGTLFVGGLPGAIEVAEMIDDSVLLEQGDSVFLLLAVTRIKMHKEEYVLELYLVDIPRRALTWMDIHILPAKIQLTVFFAGVPATGSYIIIALQENRVPVVYTLIGEMLKEFARLSTPRVGWSQHLTVPNRYVPGIQDHYLLLGQNDRTTILSRLVMKGAALPSRELHCDLNEFNIP